MQLDHCVRRLLPLLLLVSLLFGAAAPPRAIVFMSDFGTTDDSVAICKGVMLSLAPQARLLDLTHTVPPFDVAAAARLLGGTTPYYPAGTVFVVVVDPGVGTPRRAIVARSKRGQFFVLPDNGLLSDVVVRDGLEGARSIANPSWQRPEARSATFHGRDVFAPVAAHLARGDDWRQVGPLVTDLVQLPPSTPIVDAAGIHGTVIDTDGPYGNLVTNVSAEQFRALGWTLRDQIPVELDARTVTAPWVATFGDVATGAPLIYIDSRGRFAMAINRGNFAAAYDVKPPTRLTIPRPNR